MVRQIYIVFLKLHITVKTTRNVTHRYVKLRRGENKSPAMFRILFELKSLQRRNRSIEKENQEIPGAYNKILMACFLVADRKDILIMTCCRNNVYNLIYTYKCRSSVRFENTPAGKIFRLLKVTSLQGSITYVLN